MMRPLGFILFCLAILAAKEAGAALALDSQESAGAAHRGTTSGVALTWTFTNTAGNKLLCGVTVSGATGPISITSPTYNTVAMTNLESTVHGRDAGKSAFAMYYLDSPATGGNTLSVNGTAGSAYSILSGCISFSGAATGVGTVTSGSSESLGTTATAGAITTANGNYIYAFGSWGSGTGGTAGSGFTRTYLTNGSGGNGGDDILGEYQQSSGGAITPTFTWTGNDVWGIVATAVTVAAAGTPTVLRTGFAGTEPGLGFLGTEAGTGQGTFQ